LSILEWGYPIRVVDGEAPGRPTNIYIGMSLSRHTAERKAVRDVRKIRKEMHRVEKAGDSLT